MSDYLDYLEVRDTDLALIGILDANPSTIWHTQYYGAGDFEVYTQATTAALSLVQVGRYITRPDSIEVGIIETLQVQDLQDSGKMIIATGRMAVSILDRRHIYKLSGTSNAATVLRGNVETAIRTLVSDNVINCTDTARNVDILALGASAGVSETIIDDAGNAAQKQVSYDNLLEYTISVLREYGLGSRIVIDDNLLKFVVYKGADRSAGNADGNAMVIFSREYDNLLESEYRYSTQLSKNVCLIGGEGEDVNRFYALYSTGATGLERREMWVNASDIAKTYIDDQEVTQSYSTAEYTAMLKTRGGQELALYPVEETFSGNLDVTNGNFTLNRDFFLGDIVTIQDNDLGKYLSVRIVGVTEVSDENGYNVSIEYETA